ncbi:MAG: hypothetical protein K0R43_2718 [Pseudoduganella sp.]|nr:hypothetical protein [Pseudoduganella sp.]
MTIKFNVFGTRIHVERRGCQWAAFYPGSDGKRRPADFVIPHDVEEADLALYLGDLFHEDARPSHPDVSIVA